jgi:hypothetical protein
MKNITLFYTPPLSFSKKIFTGFITLLQIVFFLGFSFTAYADRDTDIANAAQKATDYIVQDSQRFNCISCHNSAQAIRAAAFAEQSDVLTVDMSKFNYLLNLAKNQQFDVANHAGRGAITHEGSTTRFGSHERMTSTWTLYSLSIVSPNSDSVFDREWLRKGADFLITQQDATGLISSDHDDAPVDLNSSIQPTSQAMHVWKRLVAGGADAKYRTALELSRDALSIPK